MSSLVKGLIDPINIINKTKQNYPTHAGHKDIETEVS